LHVVFDQSGGGGQCVQVTDGHIAWQVPAEIESRSRRGSYGYAGQLCDFLGKDPFPANDHTGRRMVERAEKLDRSEVVNPPCSMHCGGGPTGNDPFAA